MEVNRLLGWAVLKLKHHYKRKHYTKIGSAQTIIDADSAATMAKYLANMRILHHEAIVDETYMNCYYDSSTQVLNNGGLTLISAEYFPFGYELLRSVRQSFSDKHLNDHGNDSV
mmetsp:Transcript_27444/g.40519  ORF Transcript_27444/g.40519 Transcript_27444/m.40519 type:complete len:114 (+) Transcript_27444:2073-2414(+)